MISNIFKKGIDKGSAFTSESKNLSKLEQNQDQCLVFPIQLRHMTNEETKEYHLKKLLDLSLKSLGEIPQLKEPNDEKTEWMHFRLSHNNTFPKVRENKIGDHNHWK
jgi:hypothetical protein